MTKKEIKKEIKEKKVEIKKVKTQAVPAMPIFPYKKQMNGFVISVVEEGVDGTFIADDGCVYKI